MTTNRKAAAPAQAGTLGTTALEQQNNRKKSIIKRMFRQRFKHLVVWMAVRGLIPQSFADFFIQRGGLADA